MRTCCLWFQQLLYFDGTLACIRQLFEFGLQIAPLVQLRPTKVRRTRKIYLCSLVQIQAFWNEREETPWRSLTKPKKLSFPSECFIQSWRTTWTGTDGLSPSSWEKSGTKLVMWSIWRETCFLVLSTMFGCWEVEKKMSEWKANVVIK